MSPYWQGYQAHTDDEPVTCNPYSPNSSDFEEWELGWQDADYEETSEDT